MSLKCEAKQSKVTMNFLRIITRVFEALMAIAPSGGDDDFLYDIEGGDYFD